VNLLAFIFREKGVQWERLAFIFDDKWIIRGSIKTKRDIETSKMILSELPIETEALVLDEAEILIKLPKTIKAIIRRRVHSAEPGDIIYRPQIPAISIFADYMDIYEPVENIGTIDRRDIDKLIEFARNVKNVVFVEIIGADELEKRLRKKKVEEGGESTP